MKKIKELKLKNFKIKNKKDIEKLEQIINEELGIDIQKYKDEEVAESFVDLLVFPRYIINWTLRPIILAILLFILGFFIIDLRGFEYLSYSTIGLALFLLTGFLGGLFFLTWKMKTDIWQIIEYSLDIMKSVVGDLRQVKNQINAKNKKDLLALLFTGVVHIVTIPMLGQAISRKVPIVGGLINIFVKRILTVITSRVKFDEELLEAIDETDEEPKVLAAYQKAISVATNGLDKVMDISFGLAQFPLKIILAVFSIILILFIFSLL